MLLVQGSIPITADEQNLDNLLKEIAQASERDNVLPSHEAEAPASESKSIFSKIWDYVVEQKDNVLSKDSKLKTSLDFLFKVVPGLASQISLVANFAGFILELFPVSDQFKERIESINNWVTALSFGPYSMDGVLTGLRKKSIWEALAFTLEAPFAIAGAMGGIGDIYVARGASAGADQLPSAAEKLLIKLGIIDKDRKEFKTWGEGFVQLPKAIWQLTKEIFTNPIQSLFNFENGFPKDNGHLTVLSSIGDIAASAIYLGSGRKFATPLGWLRGAASLIFDGALFSHPQRGGKIAGGLFTAEAVLDSVARYCGRFGPAVNQLAHGVGRLACEFYKNTLKAQPVAAAA